jgi:hypothetical protein
MSYDGRVRRAAAWLVAARNGAGAAPGPRSPRPVALPQPPPATPPVAAEPATRQDTLGSRPADPTQRLPDGLATLMVQRAVSTSGEAAYVLTGASGGSDGRTFATPAPQLPPHRINLGRIRRDGAYPTQFYRAVLSWSELQRPLADWLNDLRDRHGDALQLVVWDDTDYEIPWEMLWLDPALEPLPPGTPAARSADGAGTRGHGAGPLGALVPVARWTTIRELDRSLLDGPAHCTGEVLGYFDERMASDGEAFGPFVHERHTDVDRFLGSLDRTPQERDRSLGLVYMGCHGTYGKDIEDLTAGLLTWYELNEPAMTALRGNAAGAGSSTLVCLNVCHSGRLVDNRAGGEDALRGFAELFLRKGAKACIATRGEVGETEARALLEHLVDHARRTPDRPLARMLRDFRAAAAAGLPSPLPRTRLGDGSVDVEGQLRVLAFLYQFMYVYYGHPLTTLHLSGGAAHEEAR